MQNKTKQMKDLIDFKSICSATGTTNRKKKKTLSMVKIKWLLIVEYYVPMSTVFPVVVNALESSRNHPPPQSLDKLSSTKPVPKMLGTAAL